jgi:tetratricopeptide (TPR) repeat protein
MPADGTDPGRSPGDEPAGWHTSILDGQGVQVGHHNVQNNMWQTPAVPTPQDVAAAPGTHNLPPASRVFVGRDLDQITALLHGDRSGVVVGQAAIHGLGGIGKTELVVNYARAHLERYGVVWWITADGPETLALGLAALTRRLHPVATLADAQEWAVGWLQSHTGWLLILDNVEDIEHIRHLLGVLDGRGHVLVTTRRDLGAAGWTTLGLAPLRLRPLDRSASIDLLTRSTGQHDPYGAAELATELGDLPLALEQAAAYISQHPGMDFREYHHRLVARFGRLASHGGKGGNTERTIARVWQVTMATIADRSALAGRVLVVMAWLAPDGLPEDVLCPLADDPDDVRDALAMLASYNMIHRGGGTVEMHRLVQAVARGTDDPVGDYGRSAFARAVALLHAAIPEDPINNIAGWPRWNALLPHIDALIATMPADCTDLAILYLGAQAAIYRRYQGQLTASITLHERVITDQRRILGDNHPDTLVSRHDLALAYRETGRVDEAIALHQDVIIGQRQVLGDDHPNTLHGRNGLALAYQEAGRVREAIILNEQVLGDFERVLGDDHPDTLNCRNNLALAYHQAGRVGAAITLHEQVLADFERVLGDDHPDTLNSRNNLAAAYHAAGRVDEAITLIEQVLADLRRVVGDDHPETLVSRHRLAAAYHAAGRVNEAITLYEQVLTESRRVLGDDHPTTRSVASNLHSVRGWAARRTGTGRIYRSTAAEGEDR